MKHKFISSIIYMAIFSALAFAFSGCSATSQNAASNSGNSANPKAAEPKSAPAVTTADPLRIEKGDYVTANYSMRLKDGELIITTRREVAEDPSVPKADWFLNSGTFEAEGLIAGQETKRAELAEAIVGMAVGERKTIELPPEKAFGPPDEKKIMSFPLTKSLPQVFNLTAQAYVHQFKTFPKVGQEVNFVPFFKSRITDVQQETVTLESQAKDGQVVASDFGDTTIRIENDMVHLTLTPEMGAPFTLKGSQGVITQIDKSTFSVDFNHPGAGKTVLMDLEVVSFVKAATFRNKELAWIEAHDAGYQQAGEKEKPMVLVLYAEWCSWSKRLLDDTIMDPRVQAYWDDFVWVKVNSNEETEYKEFYEQDGYPMIVLVNSQGEVFKKIGGFQDARAFSRELGICLKNEVQSKS